MPFRFKSVFWYTYKRSTLLQENLQKPQPVKPIDISVLQPYFIQIERQSQMLLGSLFVYMLQKEGSNGKRLKKALFLPLPEGRSNTAENAGKVAVSCFFAL